MNALTIIDEAPARQEMATPMTMLALAVERGADLAQLERLMDLQDRYEKREARKAYTAAMAAFKANPPEIVKDKQVSFPSSKGKTEYKHATLGNVCAAIVRGLAEHGISHSWDTKQENGRITVTCVLTHSQGHSESVSLHSPPEDSGTKNAIQAIGSAVTYLQRYTLLAATGLATEDMDNDGQTASSKRKAAGGAVDPFSPQESQAPAWQEWHPDGWGMFVPGDDGVPLQDYPFEIAMKVWRSRPDEPALCAWGFGFITRALKTLRETYDLLRSKAADMPPNPEDMTPDQLHKCANYLEKRLAKEGRAV